MFIHHFTKGGWATCSILDDPHKEGVFEGTVYGVKVT